MKWSRWAHLAGLAMAGTLAGACGGGGGDEDAGGKTAGGADQPETALEVLSAFYPIHEAVSRIGGDRVEARNLTPAGVEPHDLELTSDEVENIEDADAVFYLGEGFMPALERALRRAGGRTLDLLDGLPLTRAEPAPTEEAGEERAGDAGGASTDEVPGGDLDPHVWLDPQLMTRLALRIEKTLTSLDPDGREGYASRGAAYREELEELDEDFATTLNNCRLNVFVTSHAAFGYLARRYELVEQAISGVSPETEPDPDRLADLADLVEELDVSVVFAETLLPKKLADALAREAGVDTGVLNPIEGLTDEEVDAGEDYASVMRTNLTALADALGCNAQEERAR